MLTDSKHLKTYKAAANSKEMVTAVLGYNYGSNRRLTYNLSYVSGIVGVGGGQYKDCC